MFGLSKPKLIGYAVAAACLFGLGLVINQWRLDSAKLKVTEKALVAEKKGRADDLAAYTKNQAKTEKHGNEFDTAIDKQHDARSDTPTRAVRLCKPATVVPAAGNRAVADHAQGDAGLPEAPGRDIEVGRDVGPELYGEADRADEVAIQLNACIDWVHDNQ